MSVPLDSDGFVRRECSTCEREFKWLAAPDEESATEPPDGGFFCPYCVVQAPPSAWFTKAQIEMAQYIAYGEFMEPELKGFKRDIERMDFGGSLIGVSANVNIEGPDEVPELTEIDDMKRVDFACHPEDPIKVLDDWPSAVHCLICGKPIEL
jgi:hypothetical protein